MWEGEENSCGLEQERREKRVDGISNLIRIPSM
jgi:hypothetical protein